MGSLSLFLPPCLSSFLCLFPARGLSLSLLQSPSLAIAPAPLLAPAVPGGCSPPSSPGSDSLVGVTVSGRHLWTSLPYSLPRKGMLCVGWVGEGAVPRVREGERGRVCADVGVAPGSWRWNPSPARRRGRGPGPARTRCGRAAVCQRAARAVSRLKPTQVLPSRVRTFCKAVTDSGREYRARCAGGRDRELISFPVVHAGLWLPEMSKRRDEFDVLMWVSRVSSLLALRKPWLWLRQSVLCAESRGCCSRETGGLPERQDVFCCLADSAALQTTSLGVFALRRVSLLACQSSESHLLFSVALSFCPCWECIFRRLPSCVPCSSGPATPKTKDFKPACFRNAGKMVWGELGAVCEAGEAGAGRELSPSLPRLRVAPEGARHDVTALISSLLSSSARHR